MLLPDYSSRRGPGAYVAPGSGGGTGDGGFVDQPVVTTTSSGDTTIKGKVKAGSFGKFVVPLATVQAGRQYTFRYTPHFALLMQQGKLAMVGFGFKTNNDFHIAGLRGDGSTGLHKYQVYGTPPNGWNAQTGHTVNDGGAAASGTQAGPNYLRLVTSADGTTYTLQSSADGSSWNTEFTGQAPSPFSNVSGATTFGVALWFNNADAGPFSITIDQFADAAAPLTDPYFSSVKLLLGFEGANGATSTTDESSSPKTIVFSGNAQVSTAQKKFGSSSALFDGSGDIVNAGYSADFNFGSGQFTGEANVRFNTGFGGSEGFFGHWGIGQPAWYLYLASGNLTFRILTAAGGATYDTVVAWAPSAGTWYHLAVDKDASGTLRLYIDGAMVKKETSHPAMADGGATNCRFGIGGVYGFPGFADMNGWIDELRITKSVARYASDSGFTVPTAAFPRS